VGNYWRFPEGLEHWFEKIQARAGSEALSCFHRLALLNLMLESDRRISGGQVLLGAGVQKAFRERTDAILQRFESEPGFSVEAEQDFFKKDISVCALRMFPTSGPCNFEVGWLGRRFLVSGGARQVAPALRCYLFDLRMRMKSTYSLHLEDRVAFRTFTRDGWAAGYRDIAQQMLLAPDIVAIQGTSWFWDPAIEKVSPKLAFVRTVPYQGGARFFRLPPTMDLSSAALADSARRRLFEQGRYSPVDYLMIWPRREFLAHWTT
jgi:hypothetical protein